jgi:hypothetical protein
MFSKNASNGLRSFIACLLVLVISVWVSSNIGKWKRKEILNWDISGYHLYLPATLIYGDITNYDFYKNIDETYQPSQETKFYALNPHPSSGNRVIKYTCGVSYFQLPFFLIADNYCKISSSNPRDGYSPPYQLAVLCSTILFVFLGLLILRKFLRAFSFSDNSIAMVILILGLGTNLYSYTAFQPGMGHPYSFFLYCVILLNTQRLFTSFQTKNFIYLGLALGLAVLIRPVDILVILVPLLWSGRNTITVLGKIAKRYKSALLLGLVAFLIPWIPQLIYWKMTTGSFLYYSYGEEGFNFLQPEIINGLFSYKKGWFIYTPLALVGFISLIGSIKSKHFKAYAISTLLFYILSFYIIFSWHMWYYGGSFGSRVMINSLPLLAIPFCILLEKLLSLKPMLKIAALVFFFGFIGFNMIQSWQYKRGIIHSQDMNKKYYWRVFLKRSYTEEDRKLL